MNTQHIADLMDKAISRLQAITQDKGFDNFCLKQYEAANTTMPYKDWLSENIDEIEEAWWIVIQDSKLYFLNQDK